MRNLWGLMTKFNTLPTNEDFRKLTDIQIDLLILSSNEDAREIEMARRGVKADSQHYDSSFDEEVWNQNVGEWDVLKDGHDANEIARQVEELTRAEDRKNLLSRFDNLDEYNAYLAAGGKTERESEVEQYIHRQLEMAEEKARKLATLGGKKLVDDTELAADTSALRDSLPNIDKAAMDKSIALFNQTNEDEDDEFTML